jgi:hypothetical protein
LKKQAYFKAAIDLYTLWKQYGEDKPVSIFATDIVSLALQIKRQIKDDANGDIVIQDLDALSQIGDIFGPGTQEVLNEGPSGL